MNCRKKLCHLCTIFVNIFLLIHLLFIVICNTETEDDFKPNSQSIGLNVSSNGEHHYRERRSVSRGQSVYYQKGYEMNRLRHKFEDNLRAPRHKPFFHTVNEVYSYYLPPKFNKINANIENFSDKLVDNHSFGTKSRSMTRASGERRFALTKRIGQPSDHYQSIKGSVRAGIPLSDGHYESDQQKYGSQYQRYIPRISSNRRHSSDSSVGGGGVTYSRVSSLSSSALSSAVADPSALIPEPQNIVKNSTFAGIPGWQRVDFPGYSAVPYTGFRCSAQPYYGYYADVNAGCQVFHVCQPDGREYSFLCPNSTLFHQKVQTCDWWWHVDCPSSPRYYYLNARIGVLPSVDATLYRFPKTS